MRELGRLGGSRSPGLAKLPSAERQSLRAYLCEQVDPAKVWTALKAALESGSQTAVVGAARLLVTELYEEREDSDKARDLQRVGEQARARLDAWLPKVCAAVLARLVDGEGPQKTDPAIVGQTRRRATGQAADPYVSAARVRASTDPRRCCG